MNYGEINFIFIYDKFFIDLELTSKSYVFGSLYKDNESNYFFKRNKKNKVYGFIYRVNNELLSNIDCMYSINFNRINIMTAIGIECWTYEYIKDNKNMSLIKNADIFKKT